MLTSALPGRGRAQQAYPTARDGAARPSSLPPESREPVFSDATIARMFRAWESLPGVLLAVSGGPDSVALMLLAAAWVRSRSGPPWLRVATVDHGLRPQSRDEAKAVAAWATSLGLAHATLVWDGPKPKTRIQELAREKRYELLLAHAAKTGAGALATAHHADDQAETILFRLIRGSGVAGLAGMASTSERDGCSISRPLLDRAKNDLVAHCEAENHPYFRDPSNTDPAYARTRIRDLLARLEPDGLNRHVLLELGRRASRVEAALADQTRRVCATLVAEREEDRLVAGVRALATEPDEIVMRVIANEIKKINEGRDIRLDRLERLAERFCVALRSGTRLCASLGGTIVELDLDGTLVLRRETERQRGTRVRSTLPRGGA
jgi:tRNA(Ile)-lysidine synthase